MYIISVSTKKGAPVETLYWSKPECLLGKAKTCDLVLQGWRVAKEHAVLKIAADGAFVVAVNEGNDLQVNGQHCNSYGPLNKSDEITVGDYLINVRLNKHRAIEAVRERIARPATPSSSTAIAPAPQVSPVAVATHGGVSPSLANEWRSRVHKHLLHLLDLKRVKIDQMEDEDLRRVTRETIAEAIGAMADFPSTLDKELIAKQVLAEAVGLGPLEDLLGNDRISEVMVNSFNEIYFEENGQLKKSEITFSDDNAVFSAIERIVAPLGRRIDESSPMVDARLKDGSRVNAIIPPLALKGPCITIRKFMKHRLCAGDLVSFGSASQAMVQFLQTAVLRKKNIVISGGTGSGKTTLLNVLSSFIPENERIITVEDAAELRLYQPNLVSLEARPSNQEGKGVVSIRDLVKNCLRMRPDRIVVGECRGGEALDMLQAMNTGHDGSLTTVHANSPRDCLSRLEVLVLMSGMELPVRAIREQISSAVDIIVQQTRLSCGARKVTSITEVTGVEGEIVQTSEIFRFRQTGFDEAGKTLGEFQATGVVPEFYEEIRRRGIRVDMSIFGV